VLTLWSYYRFSGSHIETLKKIWMEPGRGFLSEEFFNMPGLGAYYSRASTYIFGDWNKCGELMGLAPYGRPDKIKPPGRSRLRRTRIRCSIRPAPSPEWTTTGRSFLSPGRLALVALATLPALRIERSTSRRESRS
jgi:hypothetical protein